MSSQEEWHAAQLKHLRGEVEKWRASAIQGWFCVVLLSSALGWILWKELM